MYPKIIYIPSLDGLRGIAIFFVLLAHGSYGHINGWIGVDLFFILSGYLITNLLQLEQKEFRKISYKNFYVRRALRLFPALIFAILLAYFSWPLTEHIYKESNKKIAIASSLLYFNNIISDDVTGVLNPLWSLSVEEHFYILWPIVFSSVLNKVSLYKRNILFFLLITIVSLFRIYAFRYESDLKFSFYEINYYKFTLCRIDSILLGALLAFTPPAPSLEKALIKYSNSIFIFLFILFSFILLYINYYSKFINYGGFILTNILCLFCVTYTITQPKHPIFSSRLFMYIGKRSYGIYLLHQPIFILLEQFREQNNYYNLIFISFLRLLVPILIAELCFQIVEKPILKLKNRFNGLKSAYAT
ncbi:acyltransferase [Spirosoma sp. 48-14]|uniref:acyltransferase family protein n=1 Tax=Spirosoma sp. 48-14 TaxID=1895854 RepID=UPI0009699DDB|nr:acyltransferase [Spirosoma sp. 48-14]OJW75071.1 MAG: hypothetical protein BGO59_19050 [Spirosoma sp. 48-14]